MPRQCWNCYTFGDHSWASLLCLIIINKYSEYLTQFNLTLSSSPRLPNKINLNSHGRHISKLFLYKICILWNCFPPAITSLASLPLFRETHRKHLQQICFSYCANPSSLTSVTNSYAFALITKILFFILLFFFGIPNRP